MAKNCWNRYGSAILTSSKPAFSELANNFVHVCLKRSESRHVHDLQFLLNIQKCFHLAEMIDLRPASYATYTAKNEKNVFVSWLLLIQTSILIYLVLSVSDHTISRIRVVVCVSFESFEYLISFAASKIKLCFGFLCLIYKSLKFSSEQDDQSTMLQTSFSNEALGANQTEGAKTSPRAVSGKDTHKIDINSNSPENISNISKMKSKEISFGSKIKNRLVNQCACESGDYEPHRVCGQDYEDSSEYGDESAKKCEVICQKSSKTIKSEIKDPNNNFNEETPGKEVFKSHHNMNLSKEFGFLPYDKTTLNEIKRVDVHDLRICGLGSDNKVLKDSKFVHNDENISASTQEAGKPSFDISTESGRAKMKAYVEAKMGCKIPLKYPKIHSEHYRSLSRVDSNSSRMRRVFVANKGWVWLTRQETNGGYFVNNKRVDDLTSWN
ncbi:hypothetical protein JCM33374_g810 [Metschnikowia sp. JCM 33374]|nr:hypothetical protein JCM33374_g810 [Metschnikowia sp. JCM 33374]